MIMHCKVASKKRRLSHHDPNTIGSNFNNGIHFETSCASTFSMEMLRENPELAKELNRQGLSVMHLAVATGQRWLVKQLLEEVGSELCLVGDKNGLLPIHTAASKGRIDILKMLFRANQEAARTTTCQGDTILHLSVKSNCFGAVEFLVNAMGEEALNAKDAKGNTILHLAVAQRKFQTVLFLLSKPRINVNAFNSKNSTPLDILFESPEEVGDVLLVEYLLLAGGKRFAAFASNAHIQARNAPAFAQEGSLTWPNGTHHNFEISRLPEGNAAAPDNAILGRVYEEIADFLMTVSTAVASMTLQSVMNPPGGFDQNSGRDNLGFFLKSNMVGLFTSWNILIIIPLIRFLRPRTRNLVTMFLVSVMIVSVISTVLAVSSSMFLVFPEPYHPMLRDFLGAWLWILRIVITCGAMKWVMYMVRCSKERCRDAKTKTRCTAGAIIVLIAVSVLTVVACCLNSAIFPAWPGPLQLDFYSLFDNSAIIGTGNLVPSVDPNSTQCVQSFSLPSSSYSPEIACCNYCCICSCNHSPE